MTDSATNPELRTQTLTGDQLLLKLIERHGVTHIAGIPGGANREMIYAETA
ncbi:MAG: thiamine pyrophosphate-dependent acetolactate synthase large subunit-like protein [Parasphingorhabdus sp.]|jgi:thiamine pyrophosphate-dependent acetolactate synthase large subunit-like protein